MRVSNVGAALGGLQAADSAGIKGSVLAEPSATRSRASSEPGCSSSASTSSFGSWSRWATSSMISESRKSAFSRVASMRPTVAPPAPNCRPIVMTGTALIVRSIGYGRTNCPGIADDAPWTEAITIQTLGCGLWSLGSCSKIAKPAPTGSTK